MTEQPLLRLLTQRRYDRGEIKDRLRPILNKPSMRAHLAGGRGSVLLKPNFVMPAPRDDASTTHPEFYMAVAELFIEQGLRVGIGESPAIGSCRKSLKVHGVLEECEDRGIDVVEFKSPVRYDGVADEHHYASLTVASELNDWQHVVNLPKLKTHQQFSFTAANKNLYGCVTGKRKFVRHNLCGNDPVRFAKMIIANARQVNCTLHIADGIEAMHVKGPRGGETYSLERIIVAHNPLALDWLFCRMTDLDPEQTPLFKALTGADRQAIAKQCAYITDCTTTESTAGVADDSDAEAFTVADDFIHAPLIHISFSPWAMVRSGWRTVKYTIARQTP